MMLAAGGTTASTCKFQKEGRASRIGEVGSIYRSLLRGRQTPCANTRGRTRTAFLSI